MDDPKLIDLEPHKWRSDRPKPREPIFGYGAGPLLQSLFVGAISFAILFGLARFVRGYLDDWWPTNRSSSQDEAPRPELKPGEETTVNGYKIKRIN